MVIFDKATHDRLLKEVPSYRLITPAVVSERLKVNGSLARRGIAELLQKGLIKAVAVHAKSKVYTRAIVKEEEPVETGKGVHFFPQVLCWVFFFLLHEDSIISCLSGAAKAAAKAKKPAAAKKEAAEPAKTEA